MAEPKTKPTGADVDAFLNGVADARRRADAFQLLEIMSEITGEPPRMWGPTMVGFGDYHYAYASGHEGDTFLTGFSPRKDALVVYFAAGFQERFAAELAKLGKAKASKCCLYVKKFADVDLAVLRAMIRANLADLTAAAKPAAKEAAKPAAAKRPKKS